MSYFEKDAVISGLGISRIGRRTGIPGLELTLEAARAAIEDAGLTANDIDGIATFGDTPLAEVDAALGIQATNQSFGFDTGGVLTPVLSAFRNVGERRARHVLVYRTVLMLGGSMTQAPATSEPNPLANPPVEPRTPGNAKEAQAVRRHRRAAGRPRLLGGELAGDALPAPHGALRNDQGAVGLAGDQQQAQCRTQPARRISRADDDGRLPVGPSGVDTVRTVRLRRADRRVDRVGRLTCRLRGGLPEPSGVGRGDRRGVRLGRVVSSRRLPEDGVDATRRPRCGRAPISRPRMSTSPNSTTGSRFSPLPGSNRWGSAPTAKPARSWRGPHGSRSTATLPLNTYGGQLSAGRMHGYWLVHEACLQLRGQAGDRQLAKRPEVAAAAAGGGPIAGCMLLTC